VQEHRDECDAIAAFVNEPLVKSVLMLHGLHPESAEARLLAALEKLQPKVQRYGAELTLIAISDESVKVSLDVRGHCGSTLDTLKSMIERELLDAAADLEIVVETVAHPEGNFVSLESLGPNINSQSETPTLAARANET
jgi:Fe-S cluster biogenesis protein NfuA